MEVTTSCLPSGGLWAPSRRGNPGGIIIGGEISCFLRSASVFSNPPSLIFAKSNENRATRDILNEIF